MDTKTFGMNSRACGNILKEAGYEFDYDKWSWSKDGVVLFDGSGMTWAQSTYNAYAAFLAAKKRRFANLLFWIHEAKKGSAYIHLEKTTVCFYKHTWEGQHVVQADGISTRLEPVQLETPFWTCTISTDKYMYRSQTKVTTALEAFKQAKADYRKYAPRFED